MSNKFYNESMYVVTGSLNDLPGEEIDLDDIAREDELFINWSPSYQNWHEQQWPGPRKSKMELDSIPLTLELLKKSRNWAILPESVVESIRDNKSFRILRSLQSIPNRTTYMVTHKYPRIGAKQGIEEIMKLALQEGFRLEPAIQYSE